MILEIKNTYYNSSFIDFSALWDTGGNIKNLYIIFSVIILFLILGHYINYIHRNEIIKLKPLIFIYKEKKLKGELYKQRKGKNVFYILKSNDKEQPFCYFEKQPKNNWKLTEGKISERQKEAVIEALNKRFNTLNFIKENLFNILFLKKNK